MKLRIIHKGNEKKLKWLPRGANFFYFFLNARVLGL